MTTSDEKQDQKQSLWNPKDAVPKHIQELLSKPQSNPSNYNYISAFYQIVFLLKDQKRTGWLDFKVPQPESIADHMYRMSIIAMSLNPNSFETDQPSKSTPPDLTKCCKIALVHDIAEALVGDITPRDANIGKVEKNRRELTTIQYLAEIIKPYNSGFAEEIVDLWLDYENQRNFEARIVKDIDKYELIIQTYEYERKTGKNLYEFIESSLKNIKTQEIKALANQIIEEREEFLKSKTSSNGTN
ncbi:unnamed protein product [Ambrosiozyma monospora]|uniref:Unnamed protein product n=1 Tax=Ambrosiozyma monospora TaxID=43982 RepID=A0ACB5T739_AMBMO|nr:unnamed protein product [Ambrosiozyma monospora]